MKQEDWTQKLRQRLAEHEEPVPADLWAGIEAQLSTPHPARSLPLRRWLAAAAILLLAIGGGYTLWHDDSPSRPQSQTTAKYAGAKKLAVSSPKLMAVHAVAEKRQASCTVTTLPPATIAEEAEPATTTTPAVTADSTTSTPLPHPITVKKREQQPITAQQPLHPNRHHRTKIQMALYAANGFDNHDSRKGVLMSDEMANTFYASRTLTPDPIYLAGYEERQHHHIPLSVGLSVSYPLTPHMALTTGVVYTRQRSDFTTLMRGSVVESQQTLHYLGLPVGISYELLVWRGLTVYTAANAQADWNMKASLQTSTHSQDIARDRLQLSAGAAVGVQYDLTPHIGLYAEPGVRHYFDNGSLVVNYFKDHPTSFSLQLGLRINMNPTFKTQ